MLAALALLLIQNPVLEVSATVDRERLAVGEQVVYTLKAIGRSTAAFRIDLPSFDGLALVERRERTDVVISREAARIFTLELELRAEQVGTWEIGAIRVEQGDASAFSPAVSVTVVNASAGSSPGLESDLIALIPRVPSPRSGRPSVFVVTTGEQVFAGDQVNVLTAAWLPRGLRLRLRQPPSLSPPALPGVWSTPRAPVPGAVASRVIDGETYDLFVGLQTVYPLNPGPLTIPPARLSWMQPGRSSTGDDRRQSVESGSTNLVVRPLPVTGRPGGFDGPVARDLSVSYRLAVSSARAGSVLQVDIIVTGSGNLPLWPSPKVAWPPEARVYEEGTEGSVRTMGQRLGGTKRFRLSVVPDSAGSLSLPPIEYPYFDPGGPAYRVARTPGILVPVLDAAPVGERTTAIPIETGRVLSPAERLSRLDRRLLAGLVAVPLLAILLTAWLRGRRGKPAVLRAASDPAERLERLVATLAGNTGGATPRALVSALRAAGVEREEAERLIALHSTLEAERFGATGTGRPTPELSRSIEVLLERIPRSVRRLAGAVPLLVAMLGGVGLEPAPLHAQSGVELYMRGEYAAAALAFRNESAGMPRAVRLYDLAAAEYMASRDAHAMAALLVAQQRAPRSRHVETLWNTLAREHEQLRRAGSRWPLTAEELLATGLILLWLAALLFIVAGRRRPFLAGAALLLSAAAAVAGVMRIQDRSVPRAVLIGGSSLRTSPHGLAPEQGTVPAFSVVQLTRPYGSWWLIETSDGALGWVPADILAVTPALD